MVRVFFSKCVNRRSPVYPPISVKTLIYSFSDLSTICEFEMFLNMFRNIFIYTPKLKTLKYISYITLFYTYFLKLLITTFQKLTLDSESTIFAWKDDTV